MEKYSFVVPAYNEEKNIGILYDKLCNLMAEISQNWELIFVNDGSRDRTLDILKDLAKNDKRVKYIDLSRNFGHQAALTAGLDVCTGDAIISMDCDLQDPPEVVVKMIKKWKEGYAIVYARRQNRQDNFLKKYTAIWYYKLLDRFASVNIPRNVADFRLIDRKVLDKLSGMKEQSRYLRGMVAWLGFKYTFVDFDRPERLHGEAGYTWEKSIKLAMDGIMNFSMLPLKLGFLLGVFAIILGTGFLSYMIFDSVFYNTRYELIKWLTVVIFMAFGVQFILIWILGEYVGRIYEESKDRPVYIINEKGNFDENIDS